MGTTLCAEIRLGNKALRRKSTVGGICPLLTLNELGEQGGGGPGFIVRAVTIN